MRGGFLIMAGMVAAPVQAQITNCHSDGAGNTVCQTIGSAQPAYVDQDWGSVFAKIKERRVTKRIAGYIEKGDCAGAEAYALKNVGIDLALQVRGYCASRR